jgi:hypothetical protein
LANSFGSLLICTPILLSLLKSPDGREITLVMIFTSTLSFASARVRTTFRC